MQGLVAVTRSEQVEVHAPPPQVQVADTEPLELLPGGVRGDEGPVGSTVQVADPRVEQTAGRDAVLTGEAGHVGLVDRHRRDAEPSGRPESQRADRDRRREVHDVGTEVGQGRRHPTVGQAEGERPVAGQAGGANPLDRDAAVVVGAAAGCDHEAVVPGLHEPVDDVAHRVGDAVHLREEGLADQGDSHGPDVLGHG